MDRKNRWERFFESIEIGTSVIILIIMTVLVIVQVFSRYLFNHSFVWSEELVRYLMIWMVMIGAALVQSTNDHIRIDYFPRMLNIRGRIVLETIFRLFTLTFMIILLVKGQKLVVFSKMFESSGLGISMFWPMLAIPVGAFLIIFYTIINLIKDGYRFFFWTTEQLEVLENQTDPDMQKDKE